MTDSEITAARIERLHELAALDHQELESLYGEELKTWLIEFVAAELPGSPPPPVNSSTELAQAIEQLARNKRAWSQRLGVLVLGVCDSPTPDALMEASEALKAFIQQCPWKYLRDSASAKL